MTMLSPKGLQAGEVPEWDLADRMGKALRHSGLSVEDVAAQLGVDRSTVGRWINGRGVPRQGTLIAWSAVTGVDFEWLEGGERARRDSNSQPSDLVPVGHLGRRHLSLILGGAA